jgi:serine/threonine protein kinase
LHTHLVSDNSSIERFKQEGQAAGALNHPNIITIHDFGLTPEGQAFLIMECFEGPTLADVLDKVVRIPEERGLRIMKQICDGLEHAHKKGVVHRDLKPSNLCLVIGEDGKEIVKIVDFGIAKLLPQEGQQRQQLTQTGQIFGSPLFMSPEQCQGKALDGRSDLYSLGCLMYESFTGVPPFMGPTAFDTMTMHINEQAKTLKKTAPDVTISPELETPIMRLLEKNPDKRYQTAAEVKADLPPLPEELQSGTASWNPSWYSSIRHNPAARATVIIFLAAVVPFSLVFLLWPGPQEDPGTMFNKMVWNVQTGLALYSMQSENYEAAKKLLQDAYNLADSKLDLPKRMTTLNLETSLGASVRDDPNGEWSTYTKEAVESLKELIHERALEHYELECKFYEGLDNKHDELQRRKKTEPSSAVAPEEKRVREIIESRAGHAEMVAAELDARRLYLYEENLLKLSLRIDKKVLGENHWRIADINMKLADCLEHMQRTPPVGPLLEQSRKIYENDRSRGRNSTDTLNAVLQLGQFYRDQSLFKKAGERLDEGVGMAERIFNKAVNDRDSLDEQGKRLQQQLDSARSNNNNSQAADLSSKYSRNQMKLDTSKEKIKESRALLIEGYNAYGDYFNQIGEQAKSAEYFRKGSEQYKEARRAMSEDSKVPLEDSGV